MHRLCWAETEMLFTSGGADLISLSLDELRAWAGGTRPAGPSADSEEIANILGGSKHRLKSFVVCSQVVYLSVLTARIVGE